MRKFRTERLSQSNRKQTKILIVRLSKLIANILLDDSLVVLLCCCVVVCLYKFCAAYFFHIVKCVESDYGAETCRIINGSRITDIYLNHFIWIAFVVFVCLFVCNLTCINVLSTAVVHRSWKCLTHVSDDLKCPRYLFLFIIYVCATLMELVCICASLLVC